MSETNADTVQGTAGNTIANGGAGATAAQAAGSAASPSGVAEASRGTGQVAGVAGAAQAGTDGSAAAAAASVVAGTEATGTTGTAASGEVGAAAAAGWPEDWRSRLAGEDKSALNMLERLADPKALFEKVRNLERKLGERATEPKRPGADATPEQKAEYRKAMGIPDKPEDYLATAKLPQDRVLGEDDKPIATDFAAAMHEVDAPPAVVEKALGWYFKHIEKQEEERAIADDQFKHQSVSSLKQEWGPDFKGNINAIGVLFDGAPDVRDALLGGRLADGTKIGDNPLMVRWLAGIAREAYPAASVLPAGNGSPAGVTARLAEIKQIIATDYNRYWQTPALQEEFGRLIAAEERLKARGKAA